MVAMSRAGARFENRIQFATLLLVQVIVTVTLDAAALSTAQGESGVT